MDTTGTDNDTAYVYGAGKRRIKKTVDTTTTKYFLDGSDVIADYDGDNVLVATYVTPGLDANLSQTRGGSTYYYVADGLGSIRNLLDSSQVAQNTYDYRAFGDSLAATENVTSPYRFTGRDAEPGGLGVYNYRNRYYYSGLGIFTSRDIQGADTHRGWGYVRNTPTMYTDPTGQSAKDLANKFAGVPVKKAWGGQINRIFQLNLWGMNYAEMGDGRAGIFFADTCQLALFDLWVVTTTAGGLTGGGQFGVGGYVELETMKGPRPASAKSFEGVFHTVGVTGALIVPWSGAGYFGQIDVAGRQWWGAMLGAGLGFGAGNIEWEYTLYCTVNLNTTFVRRCICYGLIAALPDIVPDLP